MSSPKTRGSRKTVLFVVTEDWYFVSHRMPMARAALASGFRVVVAARVDSHRDAIEREGFELVDLPVLGRGQAFHREFLTLARLVELMRSLRPSVVQLIAMKPVVIGSIASWLSGSPPTLCTLTGLGHVFTSDKLKARLLRPLVGFLLRTFLRRPSVHLVVQNTEDRELVVRERLCLPEACSMIQGSGVDCY